MDLFLSPESAVTSTVLKKMLNATNLWALAKQWAERRVKNLENGRLDGETNFKDLNPRHVPSHEQ